MKKTVKLFSVIALIAGIILLSACSPVDTSSNKAKTETETTEFKYKYKDIVPPVISSDDRVMSVFFDISYYNVENYSEIYLGKDFKISGVFDGVALSVPSKLGSLLKKGFTLAPDSEYSVDSTIYAGEKCFVSFLSLSGNRIYAEFYNNSAKSKTLSDCTLVKYECREQDGSEDTSALLSVNGISGASSLSEAITTLGYPSHFHKEDSGLYSLDYFLDKSDLRDRITLYANPQEDTVTAVSFCKYTK